MFIVIILSLYLSLVISFLVYLQYLPMNLSLRVPIFLLWKMFGLSACVSLRLLECYSITLSYLLTLLIAYMSIFF